jgi:hypothetical protein
MPSDATPPEPLSSDPEENRKLENEILKLSLQAQYGDAFQMGSMGDLPSEIENEFLKNIIAYEEAHQNVEYIKVYERLGKPEYKKAAELTDEQISLELAYINNLMMEKKVVLDVLSKYDDRTIYTFITEELFEHETEANAGVIPGMVTHFTYEEFHPNHKYDINDRAMEFLSDWFEQKFSGYSWELGDSFILSNGTILTKEDVLNKIKLVFQSYKKFTNYQFAINNISFQLNDEVATGMGHAEGGVKYDALLENGEQLHIEGAFKLYMSYEHEWWKIFYFVFPGFEW